MCIRDRYEDGRHPKEVTFTSRLEEDLKRRDFTINAMAYNDDERLVDAFGGMRAVSYTHLIRGESSAVYFLLSGMGKIL